MRACTIARSWPGWCIVLAGCFSDAPPLEPSTTGSSGPTTDDTSSPIDSTSSPSTSGAMVDSSSASSGDPESGVDSSSSDETGAAPSYCSTIEAQLGFPVLACRDFDDPDAEIGGWTEVENMGADVEVLANETTPSPPNALRAWFPARAGEMPYAAISTGIGDQVLLTRVRFRMELEACDGTTPIVSLQYGGDQPYGVELEMTAVGLQLVVSDAGGMQTYHELDPEVLAASRPWSQWEIAVDVDSDYVDVLVDEMFAAQVVEIDTPDAVPPPPSIHLGVLGGGAKYGCGVWFDEIAVY